MRRKSQSITALLAHASLILGGVIGFLSGILGRQVATILVVAYGVLALPVLLLQRRLQRSSAEDESAESGRLKTLLRSKLDKRKQKGIPS